MKKLLASLLGTLVLAFSAVSLAACNEGGASGGKIDVYMPDGAPALAMTQLMNYGAGFGEDVEYHVVGSDEITSFVTYKDEDRNADLCVLPVNEASKLLGGGERYVMLGAVTHGNLYILSNKEGEDVTRENCATTLANTKIGVVNLPAFPGAVTKLLLKKYNISSGVTLENVAPTAVSGDGGYDYYIVPEPAASTRTGNEKLNLKIAGSLQELYGEGGYPQAVLVAKRGLVSSKPSFVNKFTAAMESAASWLMLDSVSAETILSTIKAHYPDPENTTAAFNAKNLSKSVISNCAIRFEHSKTCAEKVRSFLSELKAAGDSAASEVDDKFFPNEN